MGCAYTTRTALGRQRLGKPALSCGYDSSNDSNSLSAALVCATLCREQLPSGTDPHHEYIFRSDDRSFIFDAIKSIND